MPATNVLNHTENDFDDMPQPSDLEIEIEIEDAENPQPEKITNRRTTDLVRVYLQEIGRVRLLGRDEEVAEAQKFNVISV